MMTHITQTKRVISIFDPISLKIGRENKGRETEIIGILASILFQSLMNPDSLFAG